MLKIMNEKLIVWSIRFITILAVIMPLAFYYFTSGSLLNFIMPVLVPPQEVMSFDPSSIRVISHDYTSLNGKFLINIELFNSGNVRIGLNELYVRVTIPSLNIDGKATLQAPFILEPSEKETIHISFSLEKGSLEDFAKALSQQSPIDLSGNAILVLNSIEIPFDFSISNFRFQG